MSFNSVDIVLVLVIVLSAVTGWRRGFILSILDLARWIGSWLAGLFLYRPVSGRLGSVTDWTETWRNPIAFILVAALVSILIQILGHALLRRIPRDVHERRTNRIFGVLPGFFSGVILAAVLSALLFAMPFADGLSRAAEQSILTNRFAAYTDEIENAFVPIFDPALRQTLNRLQTIEPGSNERVELPFHVENAPPAPTLETQMLELINRERAAAGLKPLES